MPKPFNSNQIIYLFCTVLTISVMFQCSDRRTLRRKFRKNPLLQCLGQAKKYIHMEYCKISAVDKCVHLILREGDISSLGTKTQNFRSIFGVLRWGPSFFSRQHQKVELLNWSFPPQIGCGFFQQKNGDSSCEKSTAVWTRD